MSERRYLHITISDRDFWYQMESVCNLLYDIFYYHSYYPNEEDLPILKEHMKHLLYESYCVEKLMDKECGARRPNVGVEYFNPRMEFMLSSDIPDWDNGESYYIPMFDDECGKVICK